MSNLQTRKSKYAMLEVDEALLTIVKETGTTRIVDMPLSKCNGLHLAEAVVAGDDFPAAPVSMMDGYAVKVPLKAGVHSVQSQIRAGDESDKLLQPNCVTYITTGAVLPKGADAVVKVEDTSATLGSSHSGSVTGRAALMDGEHEVNINVDVTIEMQNIREIGSDIKSGEVVIKEGTILGAVEVGLLATIGVATVKCYQRPCVGVMSTGNELVEADFEGELEKGMIRDSNRASLLAAFSSEGFPLVDLGISGDSKAALTAMLSQALSRCDVIITSGGVSMGDADLVKPLLEEKGKVHFGRVNMKPGKPTTFATVAVEDEGRSVLVFGLPGNPVSCLVTKSLFVDPALRRLQGESSDACLHVQTKATLVAGLDTRKGLKLDMERPEYHRGVLELEASTGNVVVMSTGATLNARSSRLLSMSAANCLIVLPAGTKEEPLVTFGSNVDVIIPRGGNFGLQGLSAPPACHSLYPRAAVYDEADGSTEEGGITSLSSLDAFKKQKMKDQQRIEPATSPRATSTTAHGEPRTMRVALLTVSDRASAGVYEDKSGPAMRQLLHDFSQGGDAWTLQVDVVASSVVPDETQMIRDAVCKWCDSASTERVDVILSSGGTGFGLRDSTPEAISAVLHRHSQGVAQALLNEGLKHTPLAVLSRPVAGTRNKTFIATLPGSVKAVKENMIALKPLLPRIVELLQEGQCH